MTTDADWESAVLTSTDFSELLGAFENDRSPSLADSERLRRRFGIEPYRAAYRIVTARTKARNKLPQPDILWLDAVRVEQATHQMVADHKSTRFQGLDVADLCCGIGGDTFALARSARSVVALDIDGDALRRLAWNLERLNLLGNVTVVKGDAVRPPIRSSTYLHIDPDRRSASGSGRPTIDVNAYRPNMAELILLMKHHPGGAIKLGPASDFESFEQSAKRAGVPTETQLVSLDGECKEATVWFGDLASDNPRSAVLLPDGEVISGRSNASAGHFVEQTNLGQWLYEVDPALLRSGLVAEFAEGHGLTAATHVGAFLTGRNYLESPWFVGFDVVEELHVDRKVVRSAVRRLGWNKVVVKTRGRLGADRFRNWFDEQPTGETAETLLVWTPSRGHSRAILARRAHDSSKARLHARP